MIQHLLLIMSMIMKLMEYQILFMSFIQQYVI